MQDNYILIGNPVEHSLSPQIHASFARQCQQNISYKTLLVQQDELKTKVLDFFAHEQNRGMNITIPFKQEVFALCDQITAVAQISRAINCIYKDDKDNLIGTNTDGAGLVADLKSLNIQLEQKHILLLGAGGATYGILKPLLDAGIKKIYIANRTDAKTQKLLDDFNFSDKLEFLTWQTIIENKPINLELDGVINASAMSMGASLPALNKHIFNADINWSYDLFYNLQKNTLFMNFCQKSGIARNFQGLGMLVEQAALAFEIWRGVLPETQSVKNQLLNYTA